MQHSFWQLLLIISYIIFTERLPIFSPLILCKNYCESTYRLKLKLNRIDLINILLSYLLFYFILFFVERRINDPCNNVELSAIFTASKLSSKPRSTRILSSLLLLLDMAERSARLKLSIFVTAPMGTVVLGPRVIRVVLRLWCKACKCTWNDMLKNNLRKLKNNKKLENI